MVVVTKEEEVVVMTVKVVVIPGTTEGAGEMEGEAAQAEGAAGTVYFTAMYF